MYQLYVIKNSSFDPKKLVLESKDFDKIQERLKNEFEKDPNTKYIIEETTGHFNSYGDLVADIVEQN